MLSGAAIFRDDEVGRVEEAIVVVAAMCVVTKESGVDFMRIFGIRDLGCRGGVAQQEPYDIRRTSDG